MLTGGIAGICMCECIYIESWYLDRDIERCVIDYKNRNEMLSWRLWRELLGKGIEWL